VAGGVGGRCLSWYPAGVPAQHSFVGLETRRRRDLLGRAETGVHRAVVPGTRVLHDDGEPVRDALLQNGKT
jgi:hypothetical protein